MVIVHIDPLLVSADELIHLMNDIELKEIESVLLLVCWYQFENVLAIHLLKRRICGTHVFGKLNR